MAYLGAYICLCTLYDVCMAYLVWHTWYLVWHTWEEILDVVVVVVVVVVIVAFAVVVVVVFTLLRTW